MAPSLVDYSLGCLSAGSLYTQQGRLRGPEPKGPLKEAKGPLREAQLDRKQWAKKGSLAQQISKIKT